MIITIDAAFWDLVGRAADVTWLIAFGTADIWVVFATWKTLKKKIKGMGK